jgi:hypothetical protein
MRERAHMAGGWLTAGPDGEQFRVTVFIPYTGGSPNTTDGGAGDRSSEQAALVAVSATAAADNHG